MTSIRSRRLAALEAKVTEPCPPHVVGIRDLDGSVCCAGRVWSDLTSFETAHEGQPLIVVEVTDASIPKKQITEDI